MNKVDVFTEREIHLIHHCTTYAESDPAGLPGLPRHNLMIIIAKAAAIIEMMDVWTLPEGHYLFDEEPWRSSPPAAEQPPCPHCNGTGWIHGGAECGFCGGEGTQS